MLVSLIRLQCPKCKKLLYVDANDFPFSSVTCDCRQEYSVRECLMTAILENSSILIKYETHPDKVTKWHLVMQQINRRIEEKMIEIRKKEKK